MERLLPIIYIACWFGFIFLASYLINWLLIRSIIRRHYRLFVAPGVIIHELSHALGCLITGSPIVEINFWAPTGGHVKHLQPHDPLRRLINDPVIALAPIWGAFLCLAILSYFLVPDLTTTTSLNDLSQLGQLPYILNPRQWQTWLYLYLVTSIIATMAPSRTDIRYALASLIVLVLALLGLLLIPGFSKLLLNGLQILQPLAIFTLILFSLAIIVAFILAIPNRHRHFVPKNQLE